MDPDIHNTQRYRPTDGRTDGHDDADSQSHRSSMIGYKLMTASLSSDVGVITKQQT